MTKRNRTKPELEAARKHREGVEFMKQMGAEKLVPYLLKHDLTMHQSAQLMEVMRTVILGKQNAYWSDKRMNELGLLEELTKDENMTDRDVYVEILTALNETGISDTMKLLEFYSRILDMYASKQVLSAKFRDLPIDEILK